MNRKLTDQQRRFADEYIICGNAAEAARRAGYSKNGAQQSGDRTKDYPWVAEYIKEQMAARQSELVASQEEVLQYLTSVLRGQTCSSVLAMKIDGSQGTIDKTPDEKERLKAAELLGKRYGLYTDKTEISGSVPVVIAGDEALED